MGGLSFLAPLYLLGALAVALPIVLHLFRKRTDAVIEFPAVRFMTASPVHQQRRRRLRELVLLALRMAALVLLAASFARPYLSGRMPAADAPLTVLAVDRSFSLGGPGTFDAVRREATAALDETPAGHAVALLAFADAAETVVPPTTDRSAVRAAIAGLAPGQSATRYASTVARAAELFGPRPGRLVIVTDLQQAGWSGPPRGGVPDDIAVEVRRVDPPLRNVAVTEARRRRGRVEAVLYNAGLEPRDVPVTLTTGSAVVSRTSVTVPPQATAQVVFDDPIPDRGEASVSVSDDGGLPADDVRYLVLDPPEAARVLIVVADAVAGRSGLYVERALGVADEGRGFAVTVVDGRALGTWTPDQLAAQQAVVLLGTRTLERRAREMLAGFFRAGGSALVTLGPEVDVATLGDVLGFRPEVDPSPRTLAGIGATLALEDIRHPVLRPFAEPVAALGDVPFQQYRPVDERGRRVLARFAGGAPALLEPPGPSGRLLIFASDLDNRWNRFPLSPAFVPFVIQVVRYLTDEERPQQTWVLPDVPAGVPPRPGVYTVPSSAAVQDAPARRLAVNVDTQESNPAPLSPDEFLAAVPRAPRTVQPNPAADARRAEDDQRLWQWGLAVMFLALVGEGLVGRRVT